MAGRAHTNKRAEFSPFGRPALIDSPLGVDVVDGVTYVHGWRTQPERDHGELGLGRQMRFGRMWMMPSGPEYAETNNWGSWSNDRSAMLKHSARLMQSVGKEWGRHYVVGHSGGGDVIKRQRLFPRPDAIVLLDATYGGADQWTDQVLQGKDLIMLTATRGPAAGAAMVSDALDAPQIAPNVRYRPKRIGGATGAMLWIHAPHITHNDTVAWGPVLVELASRLPRV